jgi:hypothetical protein
VSTQGERSGFFPDAPPVPPIVHDSNEEVRVRRGELRDWADEVEQVVHTPIEAPNLWKSAGIGIAVSAVFFGGTLAIAYVPHGSPRPDVWLVVPAAAIFAVGVLLALFTGQVDGEAKVAGYSRATALANKMRHADTRTPPLS